MKSKNRHLNEVDRHITYITNGEYMTDIKPQTIRFNPEKKEVPLCDGVSITMIRIPVPEAGRVLLGSPDVVFWRKCNHEEERIIEQGGIPENELQERPYPETMPVESSGWLKDYEMQDDKTDDVDFSEKEKIDDALPGDVCVPYSEYDSIPTEEQMQEETEPSERETSDNVEWRSGDDGVIVGEEPPDGDMAPEIRYVLPDELSNWRRQGQDVFVPFAYRGIDEERHEERIGSYYLASFAVTQELWEKVMGDEKIKMIHPEIVGKNYPVIYVSYEEAIQFCRRLNEKVSVVFPDGAYEFSLPTAAQWEYAARAVYPNESQIDDNIITMDDHRDYLNKNAWWFENAGYVLHPVGQLQSNSWGLYDMLGNVEEWTAARGGYCNYARRDQKRIDYITRGGSFHDFLRECRITHQKHYSSPRYGGQYNGFRLALVPKWSLAVI